jgi:DNA-binding CsgD family transcriptional regulator
MLEDGEGAGSSRMPRVIGLASGSTPSDVSAVPEVDAICRREDAPRVLVNEVLGLVTAGGNAPGGCDTAAEVCLSPREEEVLHYLASGFTHDQVARRIGVSRHTVDTYVKRLRTKLDAGNKAQLVNAAWRLRAAELGAMA